MCWDVLLLLLYNMVTGASACQPKQRSGNNWVYMPTSNVWTHFLCHNITSPSLQYLGAQPRPLLMFYSGIDRLPPTAPCTLLTKIKSLIHFIISSKRGIFVIPALPPRKVLCVDVVLLADKGNCSKSWQSIPSNVILYVTVDTKHSHPKQYRKDYRPQSDLNPVLIVV